MARDMRQQLHGIARVAFALAAFTGLALAQGDPEKEIKSKLPSERIAAIEGLKKLGGEKAEKLLITALIDRDWEVVECAALALIEVGTKEAVPQLSRVAIDAPARRMRRAAARALAKIDPEKSTESLSKQTAGKNAAAAWEALAVIVPHASDAHGELFTKNLEKSQKSKEEFERRAAAAALACAPPEVVLETLGLYLGGDDVANACFALRAAASKPHAVYVAPIVTALSKAKLDDVLERRAIAALREMAPSTTDAVKQALAQLAASTEGAVAARAMRFAAALGTVEKAGVKLLESEVDAALAKGLASSDANVRCAALHAGGELVHAETLKQARQLAQNDGNARVRLIAVHELVRHVGIADADVFRTLTDKLNDTDALVREDAAVAVGGAPTEAAAKALEPLLRDSEWTVAACAAVSLGKTHQERGLKPLLDMAKESDWRRRGAAVVGLCHITRNEAVPAIVAAVGDAEPAIARYAYDYLKALSKQDLEMKPEPWLAWWDANKATFKMWTTEEVKARREKYGYSSGGASNAAEVFQGLDVIVLLTRSGGDEIQKVLDLVSTPWNQSKSDSKIEGIPYRTTMAAKHKADGLQPGAIYVSNCPGEVEAEDLERIAWFVRTGGYLFGSCWSLHETIEKVYPGVVRKFETKGEVMDTVRAEPCAPNSAWLKGVFDGGVEAEYNLEGAHLIELLDRERCVVLVDSPECATRWGIGNLTVLFRTGHGLILDSVNHFNNQGLINATWIKEVEERQAYALDHMGLSYEDWRASQDEKWWSSNNKAAERIYDRTALDLVTNVVRSKRLEDP